MAKNAVPYGQRLTLSPREAAGLLGVSETLIRGQIAEGTIPATRLGKRLLIPRAAIEALGRMPQADARQLRAL